ncbi:MAG TPA: XdhC family protein [Fluviicoccus sp.]|nr:XdhC family protein [Fluviicoccus sp.]
MAEIEVWRAIREQLAAGRDCALLAVADSHGSSPGKTGALMAVLADGPLAGTIGGGRVEAERVTAAMTALKSGAFTPGLVKRTHRPDSADASGMICGGGQTVVSALLRPSQLLLVEQMLAMLDAGGQAVWCLTNGGWTLLREKAETGLTLIGTDWRYVHRSGCRESVWLVGGGHVSLALSRLLRPLEFRVTVIEERSGIRSFADNAFAHERLCAPYETLANLIPEGDRHYVAVMTHSHDRDAAALAALQGRHYGYLGLLGSRRKVHELLGERPYPAHIHAPMGMPVGSVTPEEIAVSIAAEMVAVRHGKTFGIPS